MLQYATTSVKNFFNRKPLPDDVEGAEKALDHRRDRLQAERRALAEQEQRAERLKTNPPSALGGDALKDAKKRAARVLQEYNAAVRQAEKEVARAETHLQAVTDKTERARQKAKEQAEAIHAEIEAKARELKAALQSLVAINDELARLETKAFRVQMDPEAGGAGPDGLGRRPLAIKPLLSPDVEKRMPGRPGREPQPDAGAFMDAFRAHYADTGDADADG